MLSTFLKILFRLGLDSGFMRTHYDIEGAEARARFAGTTALFAAAVSGLGFFLFWLFSPAVTRAIFDDTEGAQTLWVRLVAADLFASSFAFVPLGLLRIEEKAARFSVYALARNLANTVLKVVFLQQGFGVTGVLVADAAASALLSFGLFFELRTRARLAFDRAPLLEALRFGLPKVPHGILAQTLNLFDRRILASFVPRSEVGLYAMGGNFASAMKFPLSAFEPAWQPFVYDQAKKKEGAREIGRAATRMALVFTALATLLALLLPDALRLVIRRSEFHPAAAVVPVLVLATLFQGYFFLSSVGISIAKQARYYPIITASATALNIGLDLWLIPVYGIAAAAWATVAGYALMALMGEHFSRRLFPLPFEARRVAALLLTGVAFCLAGASLGTSLPAIAARVFMGALFCAGTFRLALDASDRAELLMVISRSERANDRT